MLKTCSCVKRACFYSGGNDLGSWQSFSDDCINGLLVKVLETETRCELLFYLIVEKRGRDLVFEDALADLLVFLVHGDAAEALGQRAGHLGRRVGQSVRHVLHQRAHVALRFQNQLHFSPLHFRASPGKSQSLIDRFSLILLLLFLP